MIVLSRCFILLSMFLNRYGSPGSQTLVLIHGIPGSADSWNGVTELLTPVYDVVVPDLLGFGKSPRPIDIHAEAQAIALGEALDNAGIKRATIVGHDFGGPISLSLYRQRPEMLASLALIATNAFPDTPIPFPLSTVNMPIIGNAMARALFSSWALKQMLRRYGGTQLGEAEAVRRIFTHALQNLDELYRDYPNILTSVTVPTLVVWGDKDPFFPLAQGERLASLLPDAEMRVIAGAGHFLPEQRPDAIADVLIALATRAANHADTRP